MNFILKFVPKEVTPVEEVTQALESIEVKLRLSTIKTLHANWLIDLYNFLTSPQGRAINVNGWKMTGIVDAISYIYMNAIYPPFIF